MFKKIYIENQQLPLFLIITLGTIVRFYGLSNKSIWLDEAVIYHISQGSLTQVISQNATQNSAPILFACIIKLISYISSSEFALRFIPALASAVSLFFLYKLLIIYFRRFISLSVTLIVSLSTTQIYYAQQVREYSFTFLLSTLTLLTHRNYTSHPTKKNLLILITILSIAILTQYGLAILISIIILNLLISTYQRNLSPVHTIYVLLTVIIATLFVYTTSLRHQIDPDGFGRQYLSVGYPQQTIPGVINLVINNTPALIYFAFNSNIFYLISLIGFINLAFLAKRGDSNHIFLPLFVIGSSVLLSLFRLYPYFPGRQLMFTLPLFYIIFGYGLQFINRNLGRHATSLLVLVLFVQGVFQAYLYHRSPSSEDLKPTLDYLLQHKAVSDVLYVYYGAKPAFTYYTRSTDKQNIIFGHSSRYAPGKYTEEIINSYNNYKSTKPKLWLLFSHCFLNECKSIPTQLSQQYQVQLVYQSTGTYLYTLQKP